MQKPHVILKTLRQAKRIIVIVVGSTVLLVGVAMIALPGPAFIVIPLGLGILATELVWARRLLDRIKSKLPSTDATKKKRTEDSNDGNLR
jgi:tellurite resistance protein TerC